MIVGFAALLLCLGGGEAAAQIIRRVSSPGKFYVDDKQNAGITYNYAVYTISNDTAATFPGLYVAVTNIVSTNRVQLAATETGVRALGGLSPGQVKLAAFYLRGPSFTGNSDTLTGLTNETHTIRVLNAPPGVGSILAAQDFSFSNIVFVIEALANKITIITNLNPYAVLGSEVPLVIGGDTGTIGGDNSVFFSPAVLGSWRSDCYELVRSYVKFTENPQFTNRIFFDPGVSGFTNFTGQSYTNTFVFRAVKPTGTNIAISPFAYVDSGSGTKHTAVTSLAESGGSNVIYSVTNIITIASHTAAPTSHFAPGGVVTYSITFSNFGNTTVDMDEIVNRLPAVPGNATYVPGSSTWQGLPIADPSLSGQELHWARPFTMVFNTAAVLTFQAVLPAAPGDYTNTTIALIGPTQLDTTADTTDDNPSSSVVTVIPVADLAVGKSALASVPATSNLTYTISVTNLGPSTADSLSVTDTLPAQVSFVSASPAATVSGSQVLWSLASLASNAVAQFSVTVATPAETASLTNIAATGSPITDFQSGNNSTPPVLTTVTPQADLQLAKTAAVAVLPGSNFIYTITVTNLGPSTAASVTVTDALPVNVTFVSASAGGALAGGNVVWTGLGNLAPHTATNLLLTVTAPLNGSVSNTATVFTPTPDPVPTNNVNPPVVSSISNLPPVAVNDTTGTPKNIALSVPVLANDSDPNGDPLTLLAVTQTNGTAIVVGANVLFTPATNFLGSVVLTYTVTDGQGGTNTALLTLNVTNRPPVALDDSAFGSNSVAQVIAPLINDSDPDGDPLTLLSASAPSGILVLNPGNTNLTFTPTNTTTVLITYTVADGLGGTATATITVVGLNTAPVANPDSASTPVNQPVLVSPLLNDSDMDGDPLNLLTLSPTNGAASLVNGTNVLFTPDTNFDGTGYVLYTISDGQGGSTAGLITITVTPVADLALGKSSPATVAAAMNFDYTISLTNLGPSAASSLSVTDNLPANVTFVSASPAATVNGREVVWLLGSLDSSEVTNLTLTVTAPVDAASLTNFARVGGPTADPQPTNNITPPVFTTVLPVADVALAKRGPASAVLPGANFDYTLTVTNLGPSAASSLSVTDALPANVAFVSASGGGAFNAGAVVWSIASLAAGDRTNFTLTVTAPVSGGITNVATSGGPTTDPQPTNNVSPPVTTAVSNLPPVAVNDNATTTKNVAVLVPVLVNDSDPNGDPLAIAAVNPTTGSAAIQGTNVSFTPAPGFTGDATVTYTITDGLGGTNSATITVTVSNLAPVADNDAFTVLEDTPLTIPAAGVLTNDVDGDGDTLTALLVADAAHGTLTLNGDGSFTYAPATNYFGPDSFTYRATDGQATGNVAIVSLTVTPVNDAPIAVEDAASTPEDTGVTVPVLVNDSDPEGTPLAIISTSTTNGTAQISGTNVVFTPGTNFNGAVVFSYTISDGTNTATANVTVTVTPLNDAPFANDDSHNTLKNMTLNLAAPGVLANDSDLENDPLSAFLVANVTHGSLTLNADGSFLYTPSSNYVGSDVFTYRAYESAATSTVATVTINVLASNTPPTAIPQTVSTPQNTPNGLTLTGIDPDGDPLTFATVIPPANGTLSGFNTNTGAITYTPNPTFVGADTFTFRANDGTADSAPATVTINVLAQADLAVFKSGDTTGAAGANVTFTITVTNLGPSIATNVVVTDQLPAGYSFVSAVPAPASTVGGLVTWPAFNLTASASSNFAITALATAGGVYTNIAAASNDTPDPDPTNNNGTHTNSRVVTFVQPLADVAVIKSGPASVYSGSAATYTILVTNHGPSIATNVVAADTLPAGATYSSSSGGGVLTNGVVYWPAVNLASGASASYAVTIIAPPTGSLTNVASSTADTPDPDPTSNNGSSPLSRTTTTVTPIADVAVGKSGPASVTPAQQFSYTISVTNLGPAAAANVLVQDSLPANLTFVSASGGGVFATNTVTWPTLASLPNGAISNFTVTVIAPATGSFTNLAFSTADTADWNPTNHNGSTIGSVTTTVTNAPFGILKGANVLNPQTGLYEQRVTVTNLGASTVAAFRLLVGNLNGTNGVPRTNVTVVNATGTNVDSRPYLQYNSPLNPGATATMIIEFFVPDRKPFTNSLEVLAVLPSSAGTNAGAGVVIDRAFVDHRFTPPRFVLEWTSVPGKTYTIIYSDVSPTGPWLVATPSVTAGANRVQWYDDGPPKTISAPASVNSRYYRVIANP